MIFWILIILASCTTGFAFGVRRRAVAMAMILTGTVLGTFAALNLPGDGPWHGLVYVCCIAVVGGLIFLVRKRSSRNR
jgi:hypothetical protein